MSRRALDAGIALAIVLSIACGEPPQAPAPAPLPAPTRTAAEDATLRHMLMDMAQHGACEALEGHFVPLPEPRPPAGRRPRVEGRLWVQDCRIEREGDALDVRLEGRGWQWIDELGAGPLGSQFNVRATCGSRRRSR